MGLKRIWALETANPRNDLSNMHRVICDLLGGRQCGGWKVQHDLLARKQTAGGPQKEAHKISFGDNQNTFLVFASGEVIEAGSEINKLFSALQSFQTLRSAKFEGIQYAVEDFMIKVACSTGNTLRNRIILEIEYVPCCHAVAGVGIVEEFLRNLIILLKEPVDKIKLVPMAYNYDRFSLDKAYTSKHLALEYAMFLGAQYRQST